MLRPGRVTGGRVIRRRGGRPAGCGRRCRVWGRSGRGASRRWGAKGTAAHRSPGWTSLAPRAWRSLVPGREHIVGCGFGRHLSISGGPKRRSGLFGPRLAADESRHGQGLTQRFPGLGNAALPAQPGAVGELDPGAYPRPAGEVGGPALRGRGVLRPGRRPTRPGRTAGVWQQRGRCYPGDVFHVGDDAAALVASSA